MPKTSSAAKPHRLPIFTLGHSSHSPERFCYFLQAQAVDVVLDVRSSPYSRRAPQFNRNIMAEWLQQANIRYVFAGKSLGGRPADPALYSMGQANYALMAQTIQFTNALRRLISWSRHSRCALVCAEADPIDCHRFLLIGRALAGYQIDVRHILPDGLVESHGYSERRLVHRLGLAQSEFFEAVSDVIADAYELQSSLVAYRVPAIGHEDRWYDPRQ